MSQTMWMRCGAKSNLRSLEARPWRMVEAQHVVSTRKWVDSDEEQAELEALIDTAKRPVPPALARFHYLLSTPFRHPPLAFGSRFGTRQEGGIWYGSDTLEVGLAEAAYYRLVFLAGTAAALAPLTTTHSAFCVPVASERAVDLTRVPFVSLRARLASPSHYVDAQSLGRQMRADGVALIRFFSARDPNGGTNIALFAPVFKAKNPGVPETWICTASPDRVEFKPLQIPGRKRVMFVRQAFEVKGHLPMPAFG